MKKLMILGGGPNQLPLIKAAKKNGYCVALCDYSDKAAGVALADEFYLVSIMDLDGVVEAAEKAAVDGIVTNSEPAMQIATDAANKLGLPANDSDVIALLSSKVRFRELQKKENFVAPASGEAENYEEALALAKSMSLPIIVKPAASSGSRGVTKVEKLDELEKAVEYALHYTRNGQAVIEEFFVNYNVDLLGGEKIDIVTWSDNVATFVCNALAPAEVTRVLIDESRHSMEVIVPDDQLSLAIGREGQNVRLAHRLTGWKIDIKSVSQMEAEENGMSNESASYEYDNDEEDAAIEASDELQEEIEEEMNQQAYDEEDIQQEEVETDEDEATEE